MGRTCTRCSPLETGGVETDTERQSTSTFRQLSLQFPFGGPVRPFIDSAGEAIADQLAALLGDRIKFVVTAGPRALAPDMENPGALEDLIEATAPSSALSFKPFYYALYLLRQCLYEYASRLDTLGADDSTLARRLASELVSASHDAEATRVARIPLAGLDVADRTVTAGPLSISRLTREELGYLMSRGGPRIDMSRAARSMPGVIHPHDRCAWPCESTRLWPAKVRTLDRLT